MISMLASCPAGAPAFMCANFSMIVYLAPVLPMVILVKFLAGKHPAFFVFLLSGVCCHELSHFFVGYMTGARPSTFSIIPHRSDTGWTLGEVKMTNVRWYNAAPTALAPFLILFVPFLTAYWRTSDGWQFESIDLLIWLVLAPQFISFWPSSVDWKLAMHSWPYLAMGGLIWWGSCHIQ